jgi:hypothetical protein
MGQDRPMSQAEVFRHQAEQCEGRSPQGQSLGRGSSGQVRGTVPRSGVLTLALLIAHADFHGARLEWLA